MESFLGLLMLAIVVALNVWRYYDRKAMTPEERAAADRDTKEQANVW